MHTALVIAVAAAAAAPRQAATQEGSEGGRFSTTYELSRHVSGVPAAESDEMQAALRRIADVLRANPLVHQPPPGAFCTWLHAFLPLSADTVVRADAAVEVIPMADGRCRRLGGIAAGVEVNNAGPVMRPLNGFGADLRDDGGTMYFAPRAMAPMGGHPQFQYADGRFVLLTRRTDPLWIPVSRERYLRAVRAAWDTQVAGVIRNEAHAAGGESAFQRWLREDKPRLLEEQRRTLDALRGQVAAAELEEMQAMLRTVMAETEAAMREADAQAGAEGDVVAEGLATADDVSARLGRMLDGMSAPERASPACVSYAAAAGDLGDAAAALVDCRAGEAVVYLNPRFLDRSLGAGAPQLILVRTSAEFGGNLNPANLLRVRIYQTTDLDGLAAILR